MRSFSTKLKFAQRKHVFALLSKHCIHINWDADTTSNGISPYDYNQIKRQMILTFHPDSLTLSMSKRGTQLVSIGKKDRNGNEIILFKKPTMVQPKIFLKQIKEIYDLKFGMAVPPEEKNEKQNKTNSKLSKSQIAAQQKKRKREDDDRERNRQREMW